MLIPPFLLSLFAQLSASLMSVPAQADRHDHASYAAPSLVQSEHLHLEWTVNWAEQTISGSVRHTMLVKETIEQVVLDVRDLSVSKVVVGETEIKVRLWLASLASSLGANRQPPSTLLSLGLDRRRAARGARLGPDDPARLPGGRGRQAQHHRLVRDESVIVGPRLARC